MNQQRRDELLDAVVDYAVHHGLAAMTWRPLALGLGVTPTTLVHRFGSKEQMIEAVQQRLRERILTETTPTDDTELATYARQIWERVSDPARAGEFRLFFAVYGQALQAPDTFADFLDHVIADPLNAFCGPKVNHADPKSAATVLIAAIRGLLLDLLTTGDHDRVAAAAEDFFATFSNKPASNRCQLATHLN